MNTDFFRMDIAGESNAGPVRHHNEDNFLIYAPRCRNEALAVVADGIGGHSRGEVASYISCRMLLEWAKKCEKWDEKFLYDAMMAANRRIFDFNFNGQRVRPMGCTIVAAVFSSDRVIVASAGDSRCYEFTGDDSLRQLTTDHRPEGYQQLLDSGKLKHLSLVSRSLGTARHLELDMHSFPRQENSRYLLCSDGLYNRLSDEKLAGIIASGEDSRNIVNQLMRSALIAGEKDNITVICASPAKQG